MPPATKDLRRAAESIDLTAKRAEASLQSPEPADTLQEGQSLIIRSYEDGKWPTRTAAETMRMHIAQMLASAGLDPRNATIEGYPHPETSGRLYRLAYDCKDGNGTVRYSDHNADPIVMARQFVEREAQSLRRNRDSVEGPLV